MAKYDDLVARIDELEQRLNESDNALTQYFFGGGIDRKDLRELERIVNGLKRQVNGVSKRTDERIDHLAETASAADKELEDRINALSEEQSAQVSTQLDFGKRLAALEQVWWNAPIGNETHRRIEQLVESSATDIERRLREELRGALDKRIAGLRSEWQYFKNLVGNDLYSLKEVQVKHGNRLDNCVAQDEDFHTRLEALSGWVERVEGRVEALEKAPTKVIIPDCSVELGVLRDRVRNLEVADAVDLQLERIRKQETRTKAPSWREVVDDQRNVADDLKHPKLKSTLFLHLSRVYGEDSTITALARIIALVEKNRGLEAWPGHSSVFRASPLDLGIAIVNDQWQVIANIAARMLSEELAK